MIDFIFSFWCVILGAYNFEFFSQKTIIIELIFMKYAYILILLIFKGIRYMVL